MLVRSAPHAAACPRMSVRGSAPSVAAAPRRVAARVVIRRNSTASVAHTNTQFPKHFTYTPGKEPVKGTPALADPKTGREPLVVAIAQLGARDYRYAEKYLRWYTERDIPTLLVVPGPGDVAMPTSVQSRSRQLLNVLSRLNDDDPRPIVFHTFNTEGYHIFGQTVKLISDAATHDLKNSIKGVVVDSGPVEPTPNSFIQTFTSWAHVSGFAPGYSLTYKIAKLFVDMYFKISKAGHYFLELRQFLLQKQKLPHLFLYSEMDIDAPPQAVEEYIHAYKAHGAPVSQHKFKYSPNVRHFVVHNSDYWNEVNKFLTQTLPTTTKL